jgi:hypothetical protein
MRASPTRSICASSAAKPISPVTTCGRSWKIPSLASCNPIRCAAARPNCARSQPLADTWGMTLAPRLFPELNVQVMASIPNGSWIEHMGFLDDLFVAMPRIEAGKIRAPEAPGHGLAFKDGLLEEYRV